MIYGGRKRGKGSQDHQRNLFFLTIAVAKQYFSACIYLFNQYLLPAGSARGMELSPGDMEVNLMLQGIHSKILHVERKSQTINWACSQCDSRERAPCHSGLRSGSGQRGVRENLLRQSNLGPAWSLREWVEGCGPGPRCGPWHPGIVLSHPSWGPLYLCP